MKKRLKVIITASMLAFCLALMGFGVYSASNHTLGVENFISFDIEDNISFNLEAKTALGSDVDVKYDSIPNTAKVLQASVDVAGTTLSSTSDNFSNGVWTPYAENAPAELGVENDVVYWMFKITNTGENPIQVRVTDADTTNNTTTLFTPNNAYRLYKKFGRGSTITPTGTSSGEIAKNGICYMLILLEVQEKDKNISAEQFNFTVHIEKASASYLQRNWYNSIASGFETVEFLGGDGNPYTGAGTATYTFGATDTNGTTALSTETETVKQITGYVNGTTLYIHSPAIIYAPFISDNLFNAVSTNLSTVTTLNLSNLDTSNVSGMSQIFSSCQATTLDISNFDTSNVIDMSSMFMECQAKSIDVSNFDTNRVKNMAQMFSYCQAISIDVSSFDTSSVTNMRIMFISCKATTLDVSKFDTSNVTNMSGMFSYCKATILDVSSFDTSNVTSMSNMFSGCQTTILDLSSFNTSSVTNMSYMFSYCQATTLDLSSFNTSSVTNMSYMFSFCQATTLDLSSFNTSSVTNMIQMFRDCQATTLDLSSFYIGANCDVTSILSYSKVQILKTPYYVGVESGIDISGLYLKNSEGTTVTTILKSTDSSVSSSITLTK